MTTQPQPERTDLAAFLLSCFEDDERVAREAVPSFVGSFWPDARPDLIHIARHDPARVLADCEARRRIVESFREIDDLWRRETGDVDFETYVSGKRAGIDEVLRLLAQPYADREGWRSEWSI